MTLQLTAADVLAARRELCRRSLSHFVRLGWSVLEPATPMKWGWALDAICEHLEAVTRGEVTKLVITVPPGMMKSLLVSVFWPAWEWGPKGLAHLKMIGTSYELKLAQRDNRRTRNLITSDWYQTLWGSGVELTRDQNEKTNYENTARGWRQARPFTSLTGERGDRVLIDDPLSVLLARSAAALEEARVSTLEQLPSRVNDPERSATVFIQQRVHQADPAGLVLARDLGYEHLNLPMEFEPEHACYTSVRPKAGGEARQGRYDGEALRWHFDRAAVPASRVSTFDATTERTVYRWDRRKHDGELLFPDRFPAAVVETQKVSLGSLAYAGQYQQRPAPREGGMFRRESFRVIPAEPKGLTWVRAWDLAATAEVDDPGAARTAGVRMARTPQGRFVVAHVVAARVGPAGVRDLIRSTAEADGKSVRVHIPQDPGAAGKVQVQDLTQHLAGFVVKASPVKGDKEGRAEPFAAQVEAGNVDLVAGPWVEPFLDEVTMFPNGKLKDQVDAASDAFAALIQPVAPAPPVMRTRYGRGF